MSNTMPMTIGHVKAAAIRLYEIEKAYRRLHRGNHVSVRAIVAGKDNPHFVEVLPSYMVMVSRANIYFKLGLGLDFWAQPIIDGSRNDKLVVVDCSEGIDAGPYRNLISYSEWRKSWSRSQVRPAFFRAASKTPRAYLNG